MTKQKKTIAFEVPGDPQGQRRPRFARIGKGVRTYKDKRDVAVEDSIRFWFLEEAGPNHKPWASFIELTVRCFCSIPKGKPKYWRDWHGNFPVPRGKKPDLSNIIKTVEDALNDVAYCDDNQVYKINADKWYSPSGHAPRMVITLEHKPEWEPQKP